MGGCNCGKGSTRFEPDANRATVPPGTVIATTGRPSNHQGSSTWNGPQPAARQDG